MFHSNRGKMSRGLTGVAAGLLALAATAASAATINVFDGPGDGELATAIAGANNGDTVLVADGVYNESTLVIDKQITLQAENDGGAVINIASGSVIGIKIRNNTVTVRGFAINLANSDNGIGISAFSGDVAGGVTNLSNITIKNNTIQVTGSNVGLVSGTAANTATNPVPLNFSTLKTTSGTAQPGQVVGINFNSQSSFRIDNATVSGNTIGTDAVPFAVGLFFERTTGTIGGATVADGNTIVGEDQAIVSRFTTGASYPQTVTIKNNAIRGWGDENNRSYLVEIGDPQTNSLIYVDNNTFTGLAGPSPRLGKTNRALLGIKNSYNNPETVFIRNNTFNVRTIGIHQANGLGSTIKGNTFNFVAANATAIVVSNKIKSSADSYTNRNINRHRIWGNTFNSNSQSGATAIEYWDHTQTSANSAGKIKLDQNVVGGPGANANTFDSGLAYFIKLDAGTGSTTVDPRYSTGTNDPTATAITLFNSTEVPFAYNVFADQNLYDAGSGAKLPSAMTSGEKATLASKIQDKTSNAALGYVFTDLSGTDTDLDGLPDTLETALGTDVNKKDTDGDGIEDKVELYLGNSPTVANAYTDADKDGLPVTEDRTISNATGDTNADLDGDGYSDGYERAAGSDPYDAASVPVLGDVNGNGTTDNNDASVIFNYYLGNVAAPTYLNRADINRSGSVDYVDAVVLFNWNLVPKRVATIPNQ